MSATAPKRTCGVCGREVTGWWEGTYGIKCCADCESAKNAGSELAHYMSRVRELRAENERLRAELVEARAATTHATTQRDEARQRLAVIRTAAELHGLGLVILPAALLDDIDVPAADTDTQDTADG